MIGGRPSHRGRELFNEIEKKAQGVKNLKFLGFQPLEVTETYFDKCKVFINTSEYEGFPNTFLQAWGRGIPVISYVDPDDVIKKNGLGLIVKSEQDLHETLLTFLSNASWDTSAVLSYFKQNHSSKLVHNYCTLLEGL